LLATIVTIKQATSSVRDRIYDAAAAVADVDCNNNDNFIRIMNLW